MATTQTIAASALALAPNVPPTAGIVTSMVDGVRLASPRQLLTAGAASYDGTEPIDLAFRRYAFAPDISFVPCGNPTTPTVAADLVQTTTVDPDTRHFLVSVGLYSNSGKSSPKYRTSYPEANNDRVGLYVGVEASADSADLWAINTVSNRVAGTVEMNLTGYELDINDNASDLYGTSSISRGLSVTSASGFLVTYGVEVGGTTRQDEHAGFHFGYVSSGSTDADFFSVSKAGSVLLAQGDHSFGVNLSGATFKGSAIQLAEGQLINFTAGAAFPMIAYGNGAGLALGSTNHPVLITQDGSLYIPGSMHIAGTLINDGPVKPAGFLPSNLPSGVPAGSVIYVATARGPDQAAGVGTGQLAFLDDAGRWLAVSTGLPVAP